jgi:UDP:flavonoid glycosyltransferase YjiC (YdhE family)
MSVSANRVLFVSSSIGLGHVTRDLAIAKELRAQHPELELSWLASSPADELIRDAGEHLLPDAADLADATVVAEQAARGARLSLIRYAFGVRKAWVHNVDVLERVTSRERFDLLIGDETYEVSLAYKRNPRLKTCPFVMIYDFIGFDSVSRSPLEKLGVYLLNLAWCRGHNQTPPHIDLSLFIGEIGDTPDSSFGFMLPNRREWAREHCQFVGYVFQFDPAGLHDRSRIRSRLGYGKEPLVICSIGGTAIGKQLLELCGKAYTILREKIPGLHMLLVGGPRVSASSLDVPSGAETRGYVPSLYEHFAACDLAVIQGGGTTTLELTALRRPFLFFPIERHCEQEIQVAERLARHQAGVKMSLSRTTPAVLAEAVVANIGREVTYPPIPTDGARLAAKLILGRL